MTALKLVFDSSESKKIEKDPWVHLFTFSGRASLSEKSTDNEKAEDRTKNVRAR